MVAEELRRARAAGLRGLGGLRRGAARADLRDGRRSWTPPVGRRPVVEARGSCCGPPSADGGDEFTVARDRGRLAGAWATSPSAGCGRPTSATTRRSASSPTGSTGSVSRPGCSSWAPWRATRSSSATRTTPWCSTSSPGSTPVPRPWAGAARTTGSRRSGRRPGDAATSRRRMAERAEGETRADVARRLDRPRLRADGLRDRQRRRPRLGRERPRRMTRSVVTAAQRVVVKVGLLLADQRRGRHRPGPDAAAGRRARRGPRPGRRGRAGLLRRDRRRVSRRWA